MAGHRNRKEARHDRTRGLAFDEIARIRGRVPIFAMNPNPRAKVLGIFLGVGCFVSLRTDAVGHTSTARHAASCSSGVSGCRANTLLPFRPMIRSGATWRDAPQSMHALSMYQSPGAESGLRMGFIGEFSGCAPLP
jgi:hypothetical protein